jgi:hypothetical protein
VLAILKHALLMRRERQTKLLCDSVAQHMTVLKREQQE